MSQWGSRRGTSYWTSSLKYQAITRSSKHETLKRLSCTTNCSTSRTGENALIDRQISDDGKRTGIAHGLVRQFHVSVRLARRAEIGKEMMFI
jgi:hypothetical protein